jgi:hypothetical protein
MTEPRTNEIHERYAAWIEGINKTNRELARVHGGPYLVIDPATGRETMAGLRPGGHAYYDTADNELIGERGERHYFLRPRDGGPVVATVGPIPEQPQRASFGQRVGGAFRSAFHL